MIPHIPDELDGLTLFLGSKGWQLSFKKAGDNGWSVHHIAAEQAKLLLNQLPIALNEVAPKPVRMRLDAVPKRMRL